MSDRSRSIREVVEWKSLQDPPGRLLQVPTRTTTSGVHPPGSLTRWPHPDLKPRHTCPDHTPRYPRPDFWLRYPHPDLGPRSPRPRPDRSRRWLHQDRWPRYLYVDLRPRSSLDPTQTSDSGTLSRTSARPRQTRPDLGPNPDYGTRYRFYLLAKWEEGGVSPIEVLHNGPESSSYCVHYTLTGKMGQIT